MEQKQYKLIPNTFFWMFLGLLGTAIISVISYKTDLVVDLLEEGMFRTLMVVELLVVIVFSLLFRKLPTIVVTILYFVYAMKIEDPENATKEIRGFINELCNVVLKYETGTIVHHHGVGKVRAARIKDELGSSYIMLEKIKKTFDPNGIMNPECVVPKE